MFKFPATLKWSSRIFVILLMLYLFTGKVYAHAQYDHSNPPANAIIPSGKSPEEVQIWFTERIEPSYSNMEIVDKDNKRVDRNDSSTIADDPYSMRISLQHNLPDGVYTVLFRNVSADDGHAVESSFSFVVGVGKLPVSVGNLLDDLPPDSNFNLWSVTIRWLNYLAMAGLTGGLAFWLLVWNRVIKIINKSMEPELDIVKEHLEIRIRIFLGLTLVLLIFGWLGLLIYQSWVVNPATFWQNNNTIPTLLAKSRFGNIWLIRLSLIILAILLWLYDYQKCKRNYQPTNSTQQDHYPYYLRLWSLLGLAIGIMLTTALNSHASAGELAWLLIPTDLIHLMSTGFWIGGLFSLVFVLPGAIKLLVPGSGNRTRLLGILIRHFSIVAIASVSLLVFTGILQAVIHISTIDNLFHTQYGETLLIKISLLIPLLCLGAYNLLKISPQMRKFAEPRFQNNIAGSISAAHLQTTFRSVVRVEVLIGVIILLIVGVLTSLGPPEPVNAKVIGPYIERGQAADLHYAFAISPGVIGQNIFEIALTNNSGAPVTQVDAVLIRMSMVDPAMGGIQEIELQAVAHKAGHYSVINSILSMKGSWQITIIIRRNRFDDIKIQATIDLKSNYSGLQNK